LLKRYRLRRIAIARVHWFLGRSRLFRLRDIGNSVAPLIVRLPPSLLDSQVAWLLFLLCCTSCFFVVLPLLFVYHELLYSFEQAILVCCDDYFIPWIVSIEKLLISTGMLIRYFLLLKEIKPWLRLYDISVVHNLNRCHLFGLLEYPFLLLNNSLHRLFFLLNHAHKSIEITLHKLFLFIHWLSLFFWGCSYLLCRLLRRLLLLFLYCIKNIVDGAIARRLTCL